MTTLQQRGGYGSPDEESDFEADPANEYGPETETEILPGSPTRRRRTPEVLRLTGKVRPESVYTLGGSMMVAISLTELIVKWFAPFNGDLAFVVVAYPLFIGSYCFLFSLTEGAQAVRDRLAALLTWSASILVLFLMLAVISYPLWNGRVALFHGNTYTQDMHTTGPLDPATSGGLQYAVIGTIEQITITMLITVPLGIACGLFLNEMPGRLAHLVRTVAAAATALPSVVAGLFIYALAIIELGLPLSGFAAGLALSIMTLPIIIRASDVVFRLVPAGLKEASYALGATRWRTSLQVTLPTARSGLATAVILGAARGIGETSPVLLTAGYTTLTNGDPFHNNQTSLPLATYKLVTSGVPNYVTRGYAAAALLMLLVLILFIMARMVGGRGAGQLSKGQRRRRAAASVALVNRYQLRRATPDWDPELERHLEQHPDQRLEPDSGLGLNPDPDLGAGTGTRPDPEPSPSYPSPAPGPLPASAPDPGASRPESWLDPPAWPTFPPLEPAAEAGPESGPEPGADPEPEPWAAPGGPTATGPEPRPTTAEEKEQP